MEHKELLKVFGERVKQLRLARGWTQGEVATRAQVTRDFLGRAERGDREPSLFVLLKLATVFGVAPAYLLTPLEGQNQLQIEEIKAFLVPKSSDEITWLRDILKLVSEPPNPISKRAAERALPRKYGRPSTGKTRGRKPRVRAS
jgi:transcriptional regulator with XRE-family HTH domain